MQAQDGTIRFSPTDLNAFLECEHLTQLSLAVARGELEKPTEENPQADLVKRKGDEHEARYLADLIADGRDVVRIEHAGDFAASARATEQAVRSGTDVIYQACFVDGAWRGFADFVERQADGSYEVVDTKLARHSKPSYVLQLCFYSEQLARLQGGRLPARMHVVLGTHARESLQILRQVGMKQDRQLRLKNGRRNKRSTVVTKESSRATCTVLSMTVMRFARTSNLAVCVRFHR